MPNLMAWIDLETTGLDPQVDIPLEIGLIVTDERGKIQYEFQSLIVPLVSPPMVPYVIDMHTQSGLFADLIAAYETHDSSLQLPGVDSASVAFLNSITGLESGKEPMVGSTVHFDRGFVLKHFPQLAKWFHYRIIDISSLKELAKKINPSVARNWQTLMRDEPRAAHRVIKDLEVSINEYRFYLDHFLRI